MYKIFIVDDEQIVLDAIKVIIDRYMENASVVGTARNGKEAVEKIIAANPHVVLMDIQMPGINGIDAIREIKEHNGCIEFIIISAYEHFEYAREAVNLGVKEYIIKPINRFKLVEVIRKAINEIGRRDEKRRKELDNIEKMGNILPVLEHGFIYSVLMNRDFGDELVRYRDILGLSDEGGYIMVIEFGEKDEDIELSNKIGSSVKSSEFYRYFRDKLKCKYKCIVGPTIINRIVVFVPAEGCGGDEYGQRLRSIETAEYVIGLLGNHTGFDFRIGIGGRCGINDLNVSYEEALKALRESEGEEIIHIMDVKENNDSLKNLMGLEKRLIENIEAGKREALSNANIIFEYIEHYHGQDFRNRVMELMILVYRAAFNMGVHEDRFINYGQYIKEMAELEEASMRRWCENRIDHILKKIKENKDKNISKLIFQAKNFIDNNYMKDISLEEVSKLVGVSPQYFSRLFKEQTGGNFIEYLTRVRIEHSKELIRSTNKSVKEICFEVGYNDPNYFSRLFRKVVGISPTEYQYMLQ